MVWLESERLLFRDHEETDLEAYCAIESDPEYRWPQIVHPREELERSFHQAMMHRKPLGLRATVCKPENRYIGRSGLYPHMNDEDGFVPEEATLAFYLARDVWGRGLATEAGRAWIDHGFSSLGLTKIHAGVNELNLRSIRVIEKLGFQLVRTGEGGGNRWRDYQLTRPK